MILPNGLIMNTLPVNDPAVLISDIDTGQKYYDASGQAVEHPRSKKRTAYR